MTLTLCTEELVATGVPRDHWCSDFYIQMTPAVVQILKRYPDVKWSTFRSREELWIEIPFASPGYFSQRQS